jgi:hypothetical protein
MITKFDILDFLRINKKLFKEKYNVFNIQPAIESCQKIGQRCQPLNILLIVTQFSFTK